MPYAVPPVSQVARNCYIMVLSPYNSPFGFSKIIPNFPLLAEQWNVSYAPACSGLSMMLRGGMHIVHSLSAAQFSELERTVFTFRPDGAELSTIEASTEIEELVAVGISHLRGTGHLVVAFEDGTVRIFSLDGAKLKEFSVISHEDGKAAVHAFAAAENSLVFLLSNGSVSYVENANERVLSKSPMKFQKIPASKVRACLNTEWPPRRDEISFLKVIPSSTHDNRKLIVIIGTSPTAGDGGLYFVPADQQSEGRGCLVSALPGLAGLQVEDGALLSLPHVFTSAVLDSEYRVLLALDKAAGVLCLLDIREVLAGRSDAPLLRMLVNTNLPGVDTQIAMCGIFPCFCDGSGLVLCTPKGRSPISYETHEFLEPGIFVLNGLSGGCEYYIADEDSKSYGQLSQLSPSFCDVYVSPTSKAHLLVEAYCSSREPHGITQADSLLKLLLSDGVTGQAGDQAKGGAAGNPPAGDEERAGGEAASAGCAASAGAGKNHSLLVDAVHTVLSAARGACAPDAQAELLAAAAYGKVFAPPSYQIELTRDYDNTRQLLRVLNTLAGPEAAFALTPEEFCRYTYSDMIKYLAARGEFSLALGLAEYCFPKPGAAEGIYLPLLLHYGLSVVLNEKNNRYTDGQLYEFIFSALSRFPEIRGVSRSLVDTLLYTENTKRLQLIRQLVDREPSMSNKVALFGEMRDFPRAVRCAAESGNSGLLCIALDACFASTRIPDPTQDVICESFKEIFAPPPPPGDQQAASSAALVPADSDAHSPLLTLVEPVTEQVLRFYVFVVGRNNTALRKYRLPAKYADPYWDSLETIQTLADVVGDHNLAVAAILKDLLASWEEIANSGEAKTHTDKLVSVTTQDSPFKYTCDSLRALTDYIASLSILQSSHQKKKKAEMEAPPPVTNVCDLFRHLGRTALASVAESAGATADRDGTGTGIGSATLSYSACTFSAEIKKAVSNLSKNCGIKPDMLHISIIEGMVEAAKERASATAAERQKGGARPDTQEEGPQTLNADIMVSCYRVIDDYVRQTLNKGLVSSLGGHVANLLVGACPAAARRSSLIGYLCGMIAPRDSAKVAVKLGDAKLFREALAAMPQGDMEIFQIAAGSLGPELRQALAEAQSQK